MTGTVGDRSSAHRPGQASTGWHAAHPGGVGPHLGPTVTVQVTHRAPDLPTAGIPAPAWRDPGVAGGGGARRNDNVTRGQTMADRGLGAEAPHPVAAEDHPHGELETHWRGPDGPLLAVGGLAVRCCGAPRAACSRSWPASCRASCSPTAFDPPMSWTQLCGGAARLSRTLTTSNDHDPVKDSTVMSTRPLSPPDRPRPARPP